MPTPNQVGQLPRQENESIQDWLNRIAPKATDYPDEESFLEARDGFRARTKHLQQRSKDSQPQ